jgi:PAS domain S-box-containing protein
MATVIASEADSKQARVSAGHRWRAEETTDHGNDRAQDASGHDVLGLGNWHFREIVETVPAAIYTTDAAGRITFYNDAAATLWGCRPELGKSEFCGSWKLYWPDGTPLPHDECPMALALKQKRPIRDMEAIAERPDGTRVPFMPYPTPIYDASGVLIGAVNMLVETTERRRAEHVSQRLAAIVESSNDAIISKDLNGIIATWNRGAERLFGYTAEEVIGKPITILIPSDRHHEEAGILERIRRGERIDHFETIRRRKDGELVAISLTVSPVRNAEGGIVGASKIARDIGERRRAEELKELLLNEMKHCIKNNLATVQALATQTLRSADSDELASFVDRLHALAGVHDLLTVQNLDRARVGDIVRRALAPFQEKYQQHFMIEGPDAVSLDANKSLLLSMTLHELGTNAVKYGALSNGQGQVRVVWELLQDNRLKLRWQESGGPTVKLPDRKGFGSRLIERAIASDGGAHFEFAPEGVTCTLEIAV